MRVVDRPVMKPMRCAAIPHRGQTAEGERWVDTGAEMAGFDNHIYLSETAVREAGRVLGLPTPQEYDELATHALSLEQHLEHANAKIEELEELVNASKVFEAYVTHGGPEPEPEKAAK